MTTPFYLIGTPDVPWGPIERAEWLASQSIKQSYRTEVVDKVISLTDRFDIVTYGSLHYLGASGMF